MLRHKTNKAKVFLMIIFDLDGTLANCEHRRHFVDPNKNPQFECSNYWIDPIGNIHHELDMPGFPIWHRKDNFQPWKPDWKSFYEACDQDLPNEPIIDLYNKLSQNYPIEIWSGRSESVRDKTENWLLKYTQPFYSISNLKMRPIGDSTPDEVLKEKWLDETIAEGKTIEMVFDDRDKVVAMWRSRDITCLQVADGDF